MEFKEVKVHTIDETTLCITVNGVQCKTMALDGKYSEAIVRPADVETGMAEVSQPEGKTAKTADANEGGDANDGDGGAATGVESITENDPPKKGRKK